jgi:hypothetical protein
VPFARVDLVVDHKVRGLCIQKYPGHKEGCPNLGVKKGCPPGVPLIGSLLDLQKPTFAIWSVFDLAAHVERMRGRHPKWTDRQLRCCRYWQPRARANLGWELHVFSTHYRQTIIQCPEATGVNVTATMASIGIHLEWPPEKVTYQVAVAGTPAAREEISEAERLLRSLPDDFP